MAKSVKKLSMEEFDAMIEEKVNLRLAELSKEEQTIEVEIEDEEDDTVLPVEEVTDEEDKDTDKESMESRIKQLEKENAEWKALFNKKENTKSKEPQPTRQGWGKEQ